MRDDPTPPDSVGTVGDDHVRWASAVVDAKAKEHPFDCLVCGSKNVVLDIKTQHVRCRMCGVSTRNVYAHAVPNDRLREMEKLDADVATGTRSRDYDDVIVEEALQKVQEAKVVEEARLREFHVESQNLEKLEIAAQERRRVALMRAKKAARGLDPNQTYAPSIRRHPPPSVVLFPGRSAFVSVVADQSDTYTWCFNGAPIPEDAPGFRGTRSCFLKIQFFTKAMCGVYTCRCSNDDGVIESTPFDSVAIVLPEDDVKRNKSLPRQPTKPCAATSTELRMATSLTSIRRVAFVGQNAWLLLSDMQHTILLYAIRKDGVVESQLPTHALTCAKRVHVIATSPWLPHFCIMYGKNAAMEVVTMAQGYRRQQVPLTHKPTCVEFAAMGSQVAVGEKRVQHGVVRILNVETLQTNMIVATAHFGGIQFLRWIPRHHNFVFSLGHDHTIKLWDTAKKECVVSFQVHTSAPSDVLVTCNAAMECTITVSTFAKQIEKWTIGALQHLLHSVGVEHSYAIVLIQKQWRGGLTRSHLR
ncbi:hypothetical protein DYB37_002419 [Aphanomyces astaci]|uniref:Uncharacterized protein n=1 Tax=Aphanomyces astaci TaxID=112090 RepID=A0A418FQH5_APHAT|nr:hypothetical protein DYB37_002419 [Aphanomyces astaci]